MRKTLDQAYFNIRPERVKYLGVLVRFEAEEDRQVDQRDGEDAQAADDALDYGDKVRIMHKHVVEPSGLWNQGRQKL